jgi:hypothetical protein
MDFQTVEIALFAGNEAAVGFTLVKVTAFDAVVVTSGHRKGVNGIERVNVEVFPVFAQ